MTTAPLAPVVAFLRRHGQGLECLEGAPLAFAAISTENFYSLGPARLTDPPPNAVLYLGRAEICPAARLKAVIEYEVGR